MACFLGVPCEKGIDHCEPIQKYVNQPLFNASNRKIFLTFVFENAGLCRCSKSQKDHFPLRRSAEEYL